MFTVGSTTLLATLYGLPISASHGVIGGLVAVGIAAHGASSLGIAPLKATVVAWVASPLLGCVTSGAIHFLVRSLVHDASFPGVRARELQPVLVAFTVTIAAAFLLVAGPSILRIQPPFLAVGISLLAGLLVAALTVCTRPFGSSKAQENAHFRLHDGPGCVASNSATTSPASCDGSESEGIMILPQLHADAGSVTSEPIESNDRDGGTASDHDGGTASDLGDGASAAFAGITVVAT